MANLTSVHVTDGIPDTGTGDVSTLDAVLAVLPAALASHGGLKVEGVASGVAVPISGTVTATNPSVAATGGAVPASATLMGFDNAGSIVAVSAGFALPIEGSVVANLSSEGNTGGGIPGAGVQIAWDNGGVFSGITTSTPLPVAIPAAAGNIAKAEDVASASGDVGVPSMAIQKASPANTAADGDYAMLQMSAGRLWTEAIIEDGGNSITVDGAISFTAPQHIIVDSGTVTTVSTVTTITNVVHVDDNSGSLTVDGTLKTAYGTATAFTKTNANLAASVTAGWKSNAIDNTSTKALDALVGVELAAVNTAPAGTKTLYLYAYGLIEGTVYTSTGDGTIDGSEGTVTFPSVTTLPVVLRLIGTVPYPVQNRAINGGPFSVAAVFGGILPDKWGVAMVNDTGMTLSVTNIYYQEITNTLG